MASIRTRTKKNGSISYSAQIVIKRKGKTVHRESRTFSKKSLAKAWGNKREIELQENTVFGIKQSVTIGSIIKDYLDNFDAKVTKSNDMLRLMTYDLADIDVYALRSADIIQHCMNRNKEAKPQTVKNDVIWLKVALSTIKGFRGYEYDLDAIDSANTIMRKQGLIASADKRDRMPSTAELWALSRHFNQCKTHYLHVLWFAIYSARRLSEICRLRWDDINHENRTIFVRDIKTPHKKELSLWAKLPISSYKIIMKQEVNGEFIFPYKPRTISSYFTRSCKILDINDLHFHDLRHLAVTNLFKKGLGINEVCHISLHQSWSTLKIYTQDDPGDINI